MSDFKKIRANGVDYGLSDVKVRDNIAIVESSATSTHAYEVKDFLIYDGVLYEVIDDISIGDTLTVFENIEAVKVADKLKHLENDKMDNSGSIDIDNVEHANTADTATYATSAGSAETATSATFATSAGTATTATSATSASTATTAGTAETANKLSNTSAIGSSTKPVYFSANGVPVEATSYSNASVLKATQDGSGNTITTYYQKKITHTSVTIASSSWTANGNYYDANVTVSGVTSSNTVHVSPAPDYLESGVYANSQSSNKIVFRCKTKPDSSVTIYVEIQD